MSVQDNRADEADVSREKQAQPTKSSMATWKKMTIAGVTLAVIIGLAVGLGVGLTRHKGSSSDDDDHRSPNTNGTSTNSTGSGLQDVSGRATKWMPKVGESWQITLKNTLKNDAAFTPDVTAWDMDLYENSKETIDKLHGLGKRVICYFSAGTWEKGREDADEFPQEDLGGTLPEWKDERWARIGSPKVRHIMKRRIHVAADKGCDAIDPDNVDGFVS